MSYDWKSKIGREKYSLAWFNDSDQRFIHAARLFAHDKQAFDRIIPFDDIKGKRVLEIGCGMGLHSELLSRAGAILTSIDLSETSVAATTRRFALKDLKADIRQMDAETLDFADGAFDFVWSWGVIHHSARTGRVVREIHRVLKPDGEARIMVYNISGTPAYITMFGDYLWKFWRGRTLDECLWAKTDGFTARYYSKDMLSDLLLTFFDRVSVAVCGQDADAVPLPGGLRDLALRLIPESWQRERVTKVGGFLLATATKSG